MQSSTRLSEPVAPIPRPPPRRAVRERTALSIALIGTVAIGFSFVRLLAAGSLVPVPDAGDASSLAMAAVATAWLLLWGLRAAVVPSHEWRWHVLRAIATTALAADELHAFVSHALYLER